MSFLVLLFSDGERVEDKLHWNDVGLKCNFSIERFFHRLFSKSMEIDSVSYLELKFEIDFTLLPSIEWKLNTAIFSELFSIR